MRNAKLNVFGMHCGSCVRHVTDVLRRLPGVQVGQVSVGSAELAFDPSKTDTAAVAAAIEAAGYSTREATQRACQAVPAKPGGSCCA